jgi:hypothetical protein
MRIASMAFAAKLSLAAALALAIGACSGKSTNAVVVPDTQPGDQLLAAYLIGDWCTNRQETSAANRAAGLSSLVNVSPVFWHFAEDGAWGVSNSGFLFDTYGTWKLEGRDTLLLAKEATTPKQYQAQFKNGGTDLYLKDDKEQFLVLAHCD